MGCRCSKGLDGHTNPPAHLPLSRHFQACQAWKYQRVLSISHRWWCEGWKGCPHTELREHCSHGFGYGQTLPVKKRESCSCPTGPQQYQGRSSFCEAEGQQGLPGWAGRVCLWAQFSNGKTESYPKVIFLSVDRVEQSPVCQAKQYKMNPGTGAGREPQLAATAWPGMLCLQSHGPSSSAGL